MNRSNNIIKLNSLSVIIYLTTKLSNNIRLSINLTLQLSFFKFAEPLFEHSILSLNSIKNTISITICFISKNVCLLTYRKLISCFTLSKLQTHICIVIRNSSINLISLLTNSKTIFTAALTNLTRKISITKLKSINSFKTTHTNLRTYRLNSRLNRTQAILNRIYRRVSHLSKLANSISTTINSLKKHITTSIVVKLIRKETCFSSTVTIISPTITISSPHHPKEENPNPVITTKSTIVLKSKKKIRVKTRSSASCCCIWENENTIFSHSFFIFKKLIINLSNFYDVIKSYCKYR